MTIDEFKTQLAEVIKAPEKVDDFTTAVEAEFKTAEATAKTAKDLETQIADKDKTIQAFVSKSLLTQGTEQKAPEPEKTPREEAEALFKERYGIKEETEK